MSARTNPRMIGTLLAFLLLTLGLIGGVAIAQTGGDGDMFYACERNGRVLSYSIRVNEEPTCAGSRTSLVSWSEVGPAEIVTHDAIDMTTSGNAWLAHADGAAPTRFAAETQFQAPGRAVISLIGPGAIDGVDYGLASFDLCLIAGDAFVSEVVVTGIAPFGPGVNDDQYLEVFRADPAEWRTGCHTFDVGGADVGQGAGLMVGFIDEVDANFVTLSAVRSTWISLPAQD